METNENTHQTNGERGGPVILILGSPFEEIEELLYIVNLLLSRRVNMEQEARNDINHSINIGANINAYNGLSSRFTNFIRGAIVGNDSDENYLDNINNELMGLEKLDKNNVIEILKKYASTIDNILLLSLEAKNDMVTAFRGQATLEGKMNETFQQIGTIMLNSASTTSNNKPFFSREDVQVLLKISEDIKKLKEEENLGEFVKKELVNDLKNCLFKTTPYVQEIILGIVENNQEFFEELRENSGVDFNKNIEMYQLRKR